MDITIRLKRALSNKIKKWPSKNEQPWARDAGLICKGVKLREEEITITRNACVRFKVCGNQTMNDLQYNMEHDNKDSITGLKRQFSKMDCRTVHNNGKALTLLCPVVLDPNSIKSTMSGTLTVADRNKQREYVREERPSLKLYETNNLQFALVLIVSTFLAWYWIKPTKLFAKRMPTGPQWENQKIWF